MEYTTLGGTGERVSRLGFGGAPAGLANYLGKFDPTDTGAREQVIEALERAVELGVTYFDTAPGYGEGASEELFGEALEGEDVILATKVELADPARVRERVEESLARLRREQIDLIQLHGGAYSAEDVDHILEGGVLSELEALRSEGKVRYLGFTTEDNNPATYDLIDSDRFDTMQINYNLMFQHPANPISTSGSLHEAATADLGTITMRTTTSGIFREWIQTVNPENDFNYVPALIDFVLSNELVDVALVGMRDPAIVEANVKLVDAQEYRVDIAELFERYVD